MLPLGKKKVKGATMIEYGLIAGLVSVASIGALTSVGSQLVALFNKIATNIASSASS